MIKITKLLILVVALTGMLSFSLPFEHSVHAETTGGFAEASTDEDGQRLIGWINTATSTLFALSGLAITGTIIYAGIQYSTAGGNPQASAAAKKRIGQAITALIALVFIYGFLQWLVPGGLF